MGLFGFSERGLAKLERELEAAKAENRLWEEQAKVLFGYQNGGIEAERAGKPDEAIALYTQAYRYGQGADRMGVNNYFYSLERLCVLYRKQKRYAEEIEVIRVALAEYINDKDRERLADRLVKAQLLQAKQEGR